MASGRMGWVAFGVWVLSTHIDYQVEVVIREPELVSLLRSTWYALDYVSVKRIFLGR